MRRELAVRPVPGQPPERGVDYPDATFDLIYAFSVFTHLAPAGQTFWIAELTRVLKPGGCLFLTTHGEHYLPQLSRRGPGAIP